MKKKRHIESAITLEHHKLVAEKLKQLAKSSGWIVEIANTRMVEIAESNGEMAESSSFHHCKWLYECKLDQTILNIDSSIIRNMVTSSIVSTFLSFIAEYYLKIILFKIKSKCKWTHLEHVVDEGVLEFIWPGCARASEEKGWEPLI